MEGIIPQNKYFRRRNKKLATVVEQPNNKKNQFHKRSNSDNLKKNKPLKILMYPIEAINLITKGPSINKLFFKNDNISLKSESVPKPNKKGVKKYKTINVDKGNLSIFNNIKIKTQNDLNTKLSNNTVNNYNMDTVQKSHELKGSAKDFYPNNYLSKENNIKKINKPNFINKNCISNDKLIIYNNIIKTNPIIEFYKPLKDNEIKKKAIQKFQSVHQEKKNYRFSDFRVYKQLKEEDLNGSLDNINPDEYREGRTNIELISHGSNEENDKSSSLSSDDEEQKTDTKKKVKKNKEEKLKNSSSINSKNMSAKMENNSNKNVYIYGGNNDNDENYFKNEITFFRSPKINSNHTSNKSLKSDAKGDNYNNFMLNINETNNYNIDNINKNYTLENYLNKSLIKKFASINSNIDIDKENEEENELTEKLDKSNIYLDNTNKITNNINDSNNLNKVGQNKNIFYNENNINMNNINYMNDSNNNINNDINNNYKETIINNYNQNNNLENYLENSMKNMKTINIFNNNLTNESQNNSSLSLDNLVRNANQSHIINIQNMNNFNNNNFILNPNQINPNNVPNYNNMMSDYNPNTSQNIVLNNPLQYLYNKNNLYNYQSNNIDNINQNMMDI